MTKKRGGQPANKNAKKVTPKKPIGLRLNADLVNRLKQEPDQTKLIEMLLTEYFTNNSYERTDKNDPARIKKTAF